MAPIKTKLGSEDVHLHDEYLRSMDVTMTQKLAFTASHFLIPDGGTMLDMGCANGSGTHKLAQLYPHINVIGIDLNDESLERARAEFTLPNLSFLKADITDPDLGGRKVDAILNSSVIHEVYSYTGYSMASVRRAIENQGRILNDGGKSIIRDAVRPALPDMEVYLDLPDMPSKGTTPETMTDADLLRLYAASANVLDDAVRRGFLLDELGPTGDGWQRFSLSHDWACEFIWRKEYKSRFYDEAREKYAYMTAAEFRSIPEEMGLRVEHTTPYYNPWIVNNWHKNRFRLFRAQDMAPLSPPPTNFITVIEKPAARYGGVTRLREHRRNVAPVSYLRHEQFATQFGGHSGHEAGQGVVWDMFARPGAVADIFPYHEAENGRVLVFVKSGYPRPLIHTATAQGQSLDGKTWSGHVTEPLAIANLENTRDLPRLLAVRFGFEPWAMGDVTPSLQYHPAPDIVDERVSSHFIRMAASELPDEKQLPASFHDQGRVVAVGAQELLRSSQVGMMAEARLEMNLYQLLKDLGAEPLPWMGDDVAARDFAMAQAIGPDRSGPVFGKLAQARQPRHFRHVASTFHEEAHDGSHTRTVATQNFEMVLPREKSASVMTILPLWRDAASGEIMTALRNEALPVLQDEPDLTGRMHLTRLRLPRGVSGMEEAKAHVAERFGNVPVDDVMPLGAGYFPSIGVLTDRFYPVALNISQPGQLKHMRAVSLRDLFNDTRKLRDAAALISVTRAVHAMNLWRDYTRTP